MTELRRPSTATAASAPPAWCRAWQICPSELRGHCADGCCWARPPGGSPWRQGRHTTPQGRKRARATCATALAGLSSAVGGRPRPTPHAGDRVPLHFSRSNSVARSAGGQVLGCASVDRDCHGPFVAIEPVSPCRERAAWSRLPGLVARQASAQCLYRLGRRGAVARALHRRFAASEALYP